MPPLVRAILFDSDGILVDSERIYFEATCAAFAAAGAPVTAAQWATWYLSEGLRSADIAMLIGMDPTLVAQTLAHRDDLFWRSIDNGAPVFPGVHETLRALAQHCRLAVVTGAPRSHYDRVHRETNLQAFFELVVARGDYEHVKPDPQAYLTALARLALQPDECVAIEDSPRGAVAAVAAGIRCIIVPTPLTDIGQCPSQCIMAQSIADLPAMLF